MRETAREVFEVCGEYTLLSVSRGRWPEAGHHSGGGDPDERRRGRRAVGRATDQWHVRLDRLQEITRKNGTERARSASTGRNGRSAGASAAGRALWPLAPVPTAAAGHHRHRTTTKDAEEHHLKQYLAQLNCRLYRIMATIPLGESRANRGLQPLVYTCTNALSLPTPIASILRFHRHGAF